MTSPQITITDAETGITIVRDMTDDEYQALVNSTSPQIGPADALGDNPDVQHPA